MAAHHFLGIDVGGTKTHALITDQYGQALGFGRSGPGNPDTHGHDGLLAVMQTAMQKALQMAGICKEQIAGAGFGIGGFDWPSQRPLMLETIRALALDCPVEPVNDAIVGLLAGASQGWGIAVIAGTGCNCWGLDRQRRTGQVTGLGMWMDEAAGASELVLRAIQVISRAWSLRGPQTALVEAFVRHTGASDALDLLEGLGMQRYQLVPADAPLVFDVARQGDQMALELVRWAGRSLGDLAVGVIRQLGFENESFEVVQSGSFYRGSPLVSEELQKTVHQVAPGARFVRLKAPPVIGGVILGMQIAGLDTTPLRSHLVESTLGLLARK